MQAVRPLFDARSLPPEMQANPNSFGWKCEHPSDGHVATYVEIAEGHDDAPGIVTLHFADKDPARVKAAVDECNRLAEILGKKTTVKTNENGITSVSIPEMEAHFAPAAMKGIAQMGYIPENAPEELKHALEQAGLLKSADMAQAQAASQKVTSGMTEFLQQEHDHQTAPPQQATEGPAAETSRTAAAQGKPALPFAPKGALPVEAKAPPKPALGMMDYFAGVQAEENARPKSPQQLMAAAGQNLQRQFDHARGTAGNVTQGGTTVADNQDVAAEMKARAAVLNPDVLAALKGSGISIG